MALFTIRITDAQGIVKASDTAEEFASLVYAGVYEPGDCIWVETSEKNIHARLQLDDSLGAELVYLTGDVCYRVPFAEKATNITPKAFTGELHYLYIRSVLQKEVCQYRNQAKNICDQHNVENLYPHAWANVETRGAAKFFACNAIDGMCENRSHGIWPYQSWGINCQADAALTVEFGRAIETDKIILFIRADFPHDAWWSQVRLTFSDGSYLECPMEKNRFAQIITFPRKITTWVRISHLQKADDPSPFPALSQLEVYGTVAE